ncbi:MAG: alpha/beta hydrolase-fold protein [Candidatus Eisenbacteria bacterium]
MHREHVMLPSEPMGRRVHLWKYGTFGLPLLVFPSAAGMAHEWEAHGMIDAMSDWIEAAKLKVYCVESNVAEAWTRKDSDPNWRVERHEAYEKFVRDELIPYIREDCRTPDIAIGATGTSMGAFYAANFALKVPEAIRWALCLSGRYDITWMTDGFNSDGIYRANPIAYVPNLDGEQLERIRKNTHLVLVCGRGKWEDGNIEDTERLGALLTTKGISNQVDLWGYDVAHEWEWWKRQVRYHLGPVVENQ